MFIITRNKEGREQRKRERGEKTRMKKTNRRVKGRDIDRPLICLCLLWDLNNKLLCLWFILVPQL